ncbi:MAG: DUF58 domain-containing protein [Burkholderiaceae bacterium]|nr:DUF58 domain-containing protein [Burkholderiaceae bacterium]
MFKFLKPQQADVHTEAQHSAAAAQTVAPNDAQAVLSRIEWVGAKRLDGLMQGNYQTLFRGAGLMLADLREYRPHDDVRHIDWNVTARMQTPYVREHEQDRDLTAWFLTDLSASIDFGSQGVSKRALMTDCVALLGHILQRRGNRIGAVIEHADVLKNLEVLPSRSGRRHLLHILSRLLSGAPPVQNATSGLKRLLTGAQQVIKQRATIFVLSDFLTEPDWVETLLALASRHDVVAVRLVDPFDRELPAMGMMTIRDTETDQQVFVDTNDTGFRKRFAEATQDHEEQLMRAFAQAGVDCLELNTDHAVHEDLINYIIQRQRFLRQRSKGRSHA